MRAKKAYLAILMIIVVSLLSACSGETKPGGSAGSPTVENIFTTPEKSTPAKPTSTTEPEDHFYSHIAMGPEGDALKGPTSPYYLYEGAELHIPYSITVEGNGRGIGLLLFLDGRPQPYKVGENGETKYMYTFDPIPGEKYIADIYFTPVAGQQGDMLELYGLTISSPNFSLADGAPAFVYTSGSCISGVQLKYEANPPEAEAVEQSMRLSNVKTTYVDTTYAEVGTWSEQELLENVEMHGYLNGKSDSGVSEIYGITEQEAVYLRYEIWGSPYVHYGLVWFVDNQPVFASEETLLPVEVQTGKKTVIEASLDMTGFDGESVVYAVLVPRNCRSEKDVRVYLTPGRTFFLEAGEDPR